MNEGKEKEGKGREGERARSERDGFGLDRRKCWGGEGGSI